MRFCTYMYATNSTNAGGSIPRPAPPASALGRRRPSLGPRRRAAARSAARSLGGAGGPPALPAPTSRHDAGVATI